MPYKEGNKYRGKVIFQHSRHTKRFNTKTEAKEWETKKRKELKEQTKKIPTGSFLDAANKYLDYCERQFNRATYTDKRKAIKGLMAVTGNIALDQITPDNVLNGYLMSQETPSLYNKRRKELHVFFEFCRDFLGLRYNPVTPISKMPIKRVMQPVPNHEEYKRLLLSAKRHDRNLLVTIANCGARRSEIFRITWAHDIDFAGRQIRLGNRKNKEREMRYRWIPMNDELYRVLQDQWKTRLPSSDYVFQNRAVWVDKKGEIKRRHPGYGNRHTARRKLMKGLCKEAGIPQMGFHALRRYFASKLVENGENLETIRQLMGHATVSTTDLYIARLKNDLREAVSRLNSEKKAPEQGTINGVEN